MNRFTFIVNPVSGKGTGERAVKLLHREIRSKIATYELVLTEREGHATEIARDAPMGAVIAVGGDGTVNEVANGIVGTGKFLGIIPTGSGNDLTKSLNIPSKLSDAIDVLLKRNTSVIDVGTIRCSRQPGIRESAGNSGVRYFVNGAGIGLDAAVAEKTRHIRYLSGTTLYIAAVLRTLGKYRAHAFEISVDSVSKASKQLLIAIGNGTCAGGAFYLTPDAKLDDGILDLCYIGDMPIHRILRLMPLVMKGKHINSEGVSFEKGREISICSDTPFFVHADGEIVGREVNKVDIGILNRKLDVIIGWQLAYRIMNNSGKSGSSEPGRRDFLSKLLSFWSLVTVIPFGTAVVKYVTPVEKTIKIRESLRVASVDDIAMNSAKIVRFNTEPVIIVHTKTGQFKAFSARCTHLGCIVQFKSEGTPHFACNCHGSQFDINGKNIEGPAPRPLVPFKATVDKTSVIVSKA